MTSNRREHAPHLPPLASHLPLAGVRILDLTMVCAGPAGTRLPTAIRRTNARLAMQAAEVQRPQRLCRGLRGCPPEISFFRVLLGTRKRTQRHPLADLVVTNRRLPSQAAEVQGTHVCRWDIQRNLLFSVLGKDRHSSNTHHHL